MIAGITLMLLAACDTNGGEGETLAEANASGNAASAALKNSLQ